MAGVFLTKEGFATLENELKILVKETLPDIKTRMANARLDGDLSENNAWITAKEEMEIARLRMSELKRMLKEAVLVNESEKKSPMIKLGDSVTIEISGKKMEIKVVPTMEADPLSNKLSEDSPIGKALIGRKAGETVTLMTPAGEQTVSIISKG